MRQVAEGKDKYEDEDVDEDEGRGEGPEGRSLARAVTQSQT